VPVFPATREEEREPLPPHPRKTRSLSDPRRFERGGSISSRAHAGRLAPAG